ncbi:MAG: glucosaminidase domain-containing protein [Chitinophagales bacterium]
MKGEVIHYLLHIPLEIRTGICMVACFLLLTITAGAQQTYDERVEQYIAQYKPIALEEMQRTGIPASITLAQGIIESSAGQSPLATVANNHFGIKCHNDWGGESYLYDDDLKQECFRKYNSAAESYKDHSEFLRTKRRYEVLFTYDPVDYKAWAKGLKQCGYATNPQYANTLIRCIEDFDLHQWDLNDRDRARWFAKMNKTNDHHAEAMEMEINHESGNECDPALNREYMPNRISVFNNIKYVIIEDNESFNDIASRFEIGINRLMRYNDITDPSQVHTGDRIYLQPKRKNGDVKIHIVQHGETMFTISKDHGIQLRELYEKNRMVLGTQPVAGQTLFLHETSGAAPDVVDPSVNTADASNDSLHEILPGQYYIVAKGDTLYSVSKKYNLTIEEIKQLNRLYSQNLYVGQKLRVNR